MHYDISLLLPQFISFSLELEAHCILQERIGFHKCAENREMVEREAPWIPVEVMVNEVLPRCPRWLHYLLRYVPAENSNVSS